MKVFLIGVSALVGLLPGAIASGADADLQNQCESGQPRACYQMGEQWLSPDDPSRALPYFERACKGGDSLGCTSLAVFAHHNRAHKMSDKQAVSSFREGCDKGRLNSCVHLGFKYQAGQGVERRYDKAAELYRLACIGGNAKACSYLGVLTENGLGIKSDPEAARALYAKGCDGGNERGCRFLEWINKE